MRPLLRRRSRRGWANTVAATGWGESTYAELAWDKQRSASLRWGIAGIVVGLLIGIVVFAPALALASMCYATRKDQGWGPLDQEETRRALSLARSAVEADFDDPIALNLSAHTIASIGGDIAGAISLMDRSLKLSPSWSEAWARSSMVRIYAGDLETAQQHAENAIRLSPLDERIFLPLCALGYRYLFAERNRFGE